MNMYKIDYTKSNDAGTIVYTAKNGSYIGYIVISDELKDDAENTIDKLKSLAIKTVMLTGDSFAAAKKVQEKLHVDKVYAELLPFQKVEKLEELIDEKSKDKSIIFVGDGINDAPVLTRADIGIASFDLV